jgi:hypothetical protein
LVYDPHSQVHGHWTCELGDEVKIFGIEIINTRILHALFGWSLLLPSKKEPTRPFEGKVTSNESDDEVWADPLEIADDSILHQANPLLMTRREAHESTVRYWMERKGFDRKEIEKPLTDERYKEIGRTPFGKYFAAQETYRKNVFKDERFKDISLPIVDAREIGIDG